MNVYDIALGTKRKDTNTKQYRWEWNEIVERLKNVEYAEHTMSQYAAMTKLQRVDAKDVGFFIGGLVTKRKVTYRQILSLDIDEADEATLNTLRTWLKGSTYVLHSTHSSTPEHPRYRVVAPLNRIVSADEYGAIMRVLHEKFKLPLDVATFDFNRIMFLPSVPKDAEYFFESKDGEPLNVEELLSQLGNWQDLSGITMPAKIQVQDPLKKGGIIGAFCTQVSIREALDIHLQDKWRPEPDGSYTLIGATTTSGGKVFDNNLHFVSFHSSDPYQGRSHNAYDLVRLYKFGEGKKGEAEMAKLCEALDIRPESGSKAKLTLDAIDDEEAKAILNERLTFDKKGELEKTIMNVEAILTYDPMVAGVFAYDAFSDAPVLRRIPYWRANIDIRTPNEDCQNVQDYEGMEDVDESFLRKHLEKYYGFRNADKCITDALNIVVHNNKFHPIRDYLNSLEWDGVPRLEHIFIDCFGVNDTLYAREVGLKFFVGAVRRVFIPAAKMDYVPVLVSDEGLGKSKFVRRMAKLWGSDTFYTFNGSKEAYEQLRGVWLMEIPELAGVQNRSTNSRKAFITKGEDRYRSAYLKYTKTYKRQCVFIASSNDVIFLDDPSEEGRRWWGMMCNPNNVKVNVHDDSFLERVDLYWAEAVHYYNQGVKPMLSDAAEAEARLLRQIHKAEDVEQGALLDYLNMPVPDNWYKMSYYERVQYWKEPSGWTGKMRDTVCTTEVAREFFEIPRSDNSPARGKKVGDAIRATGLFTQDGSKKRFGEYGIALAWVRKQSILKVVKESKK